MSDDATVKNRGGRPAERDEPKRAPINMRTTPTIRAALQSAADEAGRSLAQEIEQRLERSLILEAELGGPKGIEFFRGIAASVEAVGGFDGAWRSDHTEFVKVYTAITRQIELSQPLPKEFWKALAALDLAQAQSDADGKIKAAQHIRDLVIELSENRDRARKEVDLIMDLMSGISSQDRAHGELAMQAIDRLIERPR